VKKRFLIGFWSLFGTGVWILYFVGYVQPSQFSLGYMFEHPIAATDYSLTLLGSSLFWRHDLAAVGGVLLIGLATASLLLIYRDRRNGKHSFWVALLFFSFLVAASVAVGRSEAGADWATISRYTSFTVLAVISVYAILIRLELERASRPTNVLIGVLSGLVLLSVPISYFNGVEAGEAVKAYREQAAFVLSTYKSQPDEQLVQYLCPSPGCGPIVRERAPILQRLDYSTFSEPQAQVLPPGPPPAPSPSWSGLSP
jgi:hypothetical protein